MKKYRYFPLEYKQQIIQEIESGLRTKAAIAREEHLSSSLIDQWQKQIRNGTMVNHPSSRERQLEKELDRYVAERIPYFIEDVYNRKRDDDVRAHLQRLAVAE